MLVRFIKVMVIATALSCLVLFQNCGGFGPQGKQAADIDKRNTEPDSIPPKVVILSKPAEITNQVNAQFQVVVDEIGSGVKKLEYRLDDGLWTSIGNVLQIDSLNPGNHQILFRAFDKQDNASTVVKHTWLIDTEAPVISFPAINRLIVGVEDDSGKVRGLVNFTVGINDNSGVAPKIHLCEVRDATNAVIIPNCSSNLKVNRKFELGTYVLRIEAEDSAGNTVSGDLAWAIVSTPGEIPAPVITIFPNAYTNAANVTFRVLSLAGTSSSPATLQCFVKPTEGTATFTQIACQSGQDLVMPVNPSALNAAGTDLEKYVFRARVRMDVGGTTKTVNSDDIKWSVDRTIPVIRFTTEPKDIEPGNSIEVKFSVSDNSKQIVEHLCKLDGNSVACEPQVTLNLDGLSGGTHVFEVVAKDKAGNENSKSTTWTNPSCNTSDIHLRWPLDGQEGRDWTVLTYFDLNRTSGNTADFAKNVDDLARVVDNSNSIQISTGDFTTIALSGTTPTNVYSKVFAAEGGEVIEVKSDQDDGEVYKVPDAACMARVSNRVVIRHANGMTTRYDGLRKNTIPVTKGMMIAKNTYLGVLGASGCATVPRLVFQVKTCNGQTIDPVEKGMFDITVAANPPIKIFNMNFYQQPDSSLDHRKMILNPPSTAIIRGPRNDGRTKLDMTVSFFMSGGLKHERIRYELVPNSGSQSDKITIYDGSKTDSLGGFVSMRINKKDGDDIWLSGDESGRSWTLKITNIKDDKSTSDLVNPIIHSKSFTLRKN